jgi:hypothetical protein
MGDTMEKSEQDTVLVFLKERIADVDQELANLRQMEEFLNLGYIDLKPIPIDHNDTYELHSGQFIVWVTPHCPNDKRDDAKIIVQMLEDKSSKINEFFRTSTPITSEISLNICKAVGIALRNGRKTLEEASELILKSQA